MAVEGAREAAGRGVGGDPAHAGSVGEFGGEGAQPGERLVGIAAQRVLGLQQGDAVGAGCCLGARVLGGVAGRLGRARGVDGLALLVLGELARAVGLDEGGEHDCGDEHERGGGDRQRGAVALPVAAQELARGVGVGGDDPAGLEALEIGGHLAGVAVASGGLAGHGLVDDRGQLVGQLRSELLERPRRTLEDRQEPQRVRGVAVGRDGREQVVEHRAEGVDIGALVDGEACGLLGRHVRGRAHDCAVDREAVAGRLRDGLGGRFVLGEVLGEAPVDHDGLAELADEDVGGLEVAVDDAPAVRVGDGLGGSEDVRQEGEPLAE
ncbi:hypothetical protein OV203_32765 [Nannocystis sp. ILAH1]|uniref:hypothetical protein n=1 Tax=Nannocystis sp. ILAH1 TaxID=2996789 RepID=UPI002271AC1A|nr:hypothetical protein [Nannocystis sp. ILAH1]MCY0991956.1 hypothetical protein [Nannocystis sp. ILAH1]